MRDHLEAVAFFDEAAGALYEPAVPLGVVSSPAPEAVGEPLWEPSTAQQYNRPQPFAG